MMSAPLAYDASYFRTISGILKCCCLVCNLIGLLAILCSSVNPRNPRGMFFIVVAVICFFITTLILLARLFQLWERKFYNFNINKYEAYVQAAMAVMFLMVSAASVTLSMASYLVATFFGYLTFSFYAFDAYMTYKESRRRDASTQTPSKPHSTI